MWFGGLRQSSVDATAETPSMQWACWDQWCTEIMERSDWLLISLRSRVLENWKHVFFEYLMEAATYFVVGTLILHVWKAIKVYACIVEDSDCLDFEQGQTNYIILWRPEGDGKDLDGDPSWLWIHLIFCWGMEDRVFRRLRRWSMVKPFNSSHSKCTHQCGRLLWFSCWSGCLSTGFFKLTKPWSV